MLAFVHQPWQCHWCCGEHPWLPDCPPQPKQPVHGGLSKLSAVMCWGDLHPSSNSKVHMVPEKWWFRSPELSVSTKNGRRQLVESRHHRQNKPTGDSSRKISSGNRDFPHYLSINGSIMVVVTTPQAMGSRGPVKVFCLISHITGCSEWHVGVVAGGGLPRAVRHVPSERGGGAVVRLRSSERAHVVSFHFFTQGLSPPQTSDRELGSSRLLITEAARWHVG